MRNIAAFLILFLLSCSSDPQPAPVALEEGVLQGDELLVTMRQVGETGRRLDEPGFNQLLEYSRHRDYLIRVQAIKALSKSGFGARPEARAAYVRALDDDHWLVRSFAVKTLGKDEQPESREALSKRLAVEENERVRGYIEEALK